MTASWTRRGTVLNRLCRQHFAFYRGYLDGLDLRELAHRYISGSEIEPGKVWDLRLAKSLLGWITEQLEVAAVRSGQRSGVRLLRIASVHLESVPPRADVPSLADFQEERDPHQMFSEHELLELYNQEYGSISYDLERKSKRNKKLRARREALLQSLELQIRIEPCLDDLVTDWLDEVLAKRLIDADITTLRALIETIEGHGFRWYTKVPRIGIKAAAHITEWLLLPSTCAALGTTLTERGIKPRSAIVPALLPPPASRTGIVPLEYFKPPEEMNGRCGFNSGHRPTISAANDVDAIEAWLASKKPGSHTVRIYRKEAERFLLWSVLERGKPLAALMSLDRSSYAEFLSDLGRQTPDQWMRLRHIQQERWMGPRGTNRWSPRWRPFEGPLSEASQKAAMVIVSGLMHYLFKKGYLERNIFCES